MKTRQIAVALSILVMLGLISACQSDDKTNGINPESGGNAETLALSQVDKQVEQTPSGEDTPPVDKALSAQEMAQLDILQDYDRDIWSGPDAWDNQQWYWKKTLKWDRHCDYVGEVETYDLKDSLQLVSIQCVPGSYQPMSYLFLFDQNTKQGQQMAIAAEGSSDNPKEIFGHIEFDSASQQLSILTLSRGLGDCGIYRVFHLADIKSVGEPEIDPSEIRRSACEEHGGKDFEQLPKSLFDYKNWPLVSSD